MRSWDVPVDTIAVRTQILQKYRSHPDAYLEFLRGFLLRLFPGVTLDYIEDDEISALEDVRIRRCFLYDRYAFQVPRTVPFQVPYVVFHTRARFDTNPPNFAQDVLPKYLERIQSLKSTYPIVLMGERSSEVNAETKLWGIESLYSVLRVLPNVTDLTRDNTTSTNTIDEFEHDAHIIHGAKFNVVFGYGGPLSMSMAFGRQTLGYIGGIRHPVIDDYLRLGFLHRSISQFLEVLQIKLL